MLVDEVTLSVIVEKYEEARVARPPSVNFVRYAQMLWDLAMYVPDLVEELRAARRERDEARDALAAELVAREIAHGNVIAATKAATERANRAERERDEARAQVAALRELLADVAAFGFDHDLTCTNQEHEAYEECDCGARQLYLRVVYARNTLASPSGGEGEGSE